MTTWLIVEDEEDIRNIVMFMSMAWGHQTLTFPDGEKAVHWLEEVDNGAYQGELPELALLDIRMPGYTGDAVAGRIRQNQRLHDIPIVLMTAFSLSQTEYTRVMDTSQADKLIRKPLPDMDELKAMLYSVIDAKKQAADAVTAKTSDNHTSKDSANGSEAEHPAEEAEEAAAPEPVKMPEIATDAPPTQPGLDKDAP